MRKVSFIVLIAIIFSATSVFAINKNQSLEYGRTLSRNASTDVDAAFYNPAGISFMKEDGFYIQGANQFIFQDRVTKYEEDTYSSINGGTDEYVGEIEAWFFPTVAAAYKMDKLGAFFHIGPVGGGSGGYYEDGIPEYEGIMAGIFSQYAPLAPVEYSQDMEFEGSEMALGFTLGASYKIIDMLSVALGYRLTYYTAEYTGSIKDMEMYNAGGVNVLTAAAGWDGDETIEVAYEEEGYGHTLIFGLDIMPMEMLNIGMKFEYSPTWEVERDVTKNKLSGTFGTGAFAATKANLQNDLDEQLDDGKKTKKQEPMSLWLGASIMPVEKLSIDPSISMEFWSGNDMTDGENDNKKTNVFSSISAQYMIIDGLKASVGYAYETGGNEKKNRTSTNMALPCHHGAIGADYQITEWLALGAGFIYSSYVESEDRRGNKYYYDGIDVSVGATLNF